MSSAAGASGAWDATGAGRPTRTGGSSSAPTGSSPTGSSPTLISIGEVLARLRDEFPDVTISKLRFLEAEGLVEPRRTPAGYRKYGPADVDRLRYVLAAQRDRFLPLRVIREQLAAIDRGELEFVPAGGDAADGSLENSGFLAASSGRPDRAPEVDQDVEHDIDAEPTPGRYRRVEVLERSGLTDAMLIELESTGLLHARAPGWYDGDALVVATVAAAFARYGLAPRHLRAYRAGADREVGMFAQLLAPLQRSHTPDGRARADELVGELTALSQRLHAALVRIGLRETLGR